MTLKIWLFFKKYLPKFIFTFIKYIYVSFFSFLFSQGVFIKFSFESVSFFIKVNPKNGTVDNVLLWGEYEKEELKIVKENLKRGDVFVDIGANIGVYSLFASNCVKLDGKVFSFEPVKYIYNQFVDSVNKNNFKNIFAYNKACGSKSEKQFINIQKKHAGGSTFLKTEGETYEQKEEVDIVVLDELLGNEEKISFIKIDTEGFEWEVLLGLVNIIKKFHPCILMEYSPEIYGKEISKSMIEFFLNNEYEILDIHNKERIVDFDYVIKHDIKMTYLFCK